MLNIYFGDMEEAIYNPAVYFKNTYQDSWITNERSKAMIKDVDKSTVIAPRIIESPVLGAITPRGLSGGVKTLISIDQVPDKVFNASTCGDNCAHWLLKMGMEKNITVNVEKDFYQRIADAALAQIGVYQDCTMLVTNSLAAVGINFHGAPAAYLSLGPLTNNPVPGDICVYQGHVALYIGNGQAVHGGWFGCQTTIYSVECNQPFIGYVHVNR